MTTVPSLKSALKSQAKNAREVKTIAHAAQYCLESFDDCLAIAPLGPKQLALLQSQRGRFFLWLSTIGVFALDRASIDFRLQDVPETHRLVKGLVQVLNDNLQKCLPRLETWTQAMAPTESEDIAHALKRADEELEEAIETIAGDVTLLHQLSNTIRKAGRESQNAKANSRLEIKDADGNNIEEILKASFLHRLSDLFPGCNDKLRQRLASTILLRRKRILYRRSRRPQLPPTRLPTAPEPKVRPIMGPDRTITPAEVKQQPTGPAETHTLKRGQGMAHSQARSTKTATTLDVEKLRPPTAPSVLSVAKTIPLDTHDDLAFPPPPRAAILKWFRELKASRRAEHNARLQELSSYELYTSCRDDLASLQPLPEDILVTQGRIQEAERKLRMEIDADWKMCNSTETEVICPYCLCALSSTDMKSKAKWRDHLRGDLDAYFCLFQECDNPCELYSHSDTWLKHMRQHAVRWQCMAKSHGPKQFEERESYESHLREAHEGVFSESQILAMAERNARMMGPLFESCPLCGIKENHPKVIGRLEDHVVGHLRYLALGSLPYIEEEEQNTNSTLSMESDDSAKPADRSTVDDLLDSTSDTSFDDTEIYAVSVISSHDSGRDPYAVWNGIESYVQASHIIRPGQPPEQVATLPPYTFPLPEMPEWSEDDTKSYLQQGDESARFIDDRDIPDELFGRRTAQWGWIPAMAISYEGQASDPILQQFLQNALVAEAKTVGDPPATIPGADPVRQRILQEIESITVSLPNVPSFVPLSTLVELLDTETVAALLNEAGCNNVDRATCAVITLPLPRILATLLSIDKVQAILVFDLYRLTDEVLPLTRDDTFPDGMERHEMKWYSTIHPFSIDLSTYIRAYEGKVSNCFTLGSTWSLDEFERFCTSQWRFSAPVFHPDKFEYPLAPESPLPLTMLSQHPIGDKPHSLVYLACIHPAHIYSELMRGATNEVAIKSYVLDAMDEDDFVPRFFAVDCDVMYAMRTIDHPHLLKSYAAFQRGNEHGFIMPRSWGSLQTFWETEDNSASQSNTLVSWLLGQLLGITHGLGALHQEEFERSQTPMCHARLTPNNILWFAGHDESGPYARSLGMLVIGDSGRTSHYVEDDGDNFDANARYMLTTSGLPSQRDDIWSLGLICFEFIIWLIRGEHEVQTFRSQTPHGDNLRPHLDSWSRLLMTDERCLLGTPLGALVMFVMVRLVVSDAEGREDGKHIGAMEFNLWIREVCNVVNASGSSYVAVHPDLLTGPSQEHHDFDEKST